MDVYSGQLEAFEINEKNFSRSDDWEETLADLFDPNTMAQSIE